MDMDPYAEKAQKRTATGWFNLLDPDATNITVGELAMVLDRLVRFTGHTSHTVLQHSVRVHHIARDHLGVEDRTTLATCLLHDAHEMVVGDVSSPVKSALRFYAGRGNRNTSEYDVLDEACAEAFAMRFGLAWPHPVVVKQADLQAAAVEVDMAWGPGEAESWGLPKPAPGFELYQYGDIPRVFQTLCTMLHIR